MKNALRFGISLIAGACLFLGAFSSSWAQTGAAAPKGQKEAAMTHHATGTFEVKVTPQATDDKDAPIGRMTLDKKFHGDIEGTSKGEMLAAMTAVKGSAGYVAIEKITGTLKGRHGTFILQHIGTMNRGEAQLSVSVVPDSGTDELVGLNGKMMIKITDGKHFYDFEYALAESH